MIKCVFSISLWRMTIILYSSWYTILYSIYVVVYTTRMLLLNTRVITGFHYTHHLPSSSAHVVFNFDAIRKLFLFIIFISNLCESGSYVFVKNKFIYYSLVFSYMNQIGGRITKEPRNNMSIIVQYRWVYLLISNWFIQN